MNKKKLKHLPINLLFSVTTFCLSLFALSMFTTLPTWQQALISLAIYFFDAVRNSEIDYLQEQIDEINKNENRKN
jgi:hypothetical protein